MRPSSHASVNPPCDCDAFVARLGGDLTLAREMARAFVADAPRLLDLLKAASLRGDADALRRAAHALKGAAGNFDAVETVGVAAQLEQTAREGDVTAALALVDPLLAAIAPLVSTLRTFGGPDACAS